MHTYEGAGLLASDRLNLQVRNTVRMKQQQCTGVGSRSCQSVFTCQGKKLRCLYVLPMVVPYKAQTQQLAQQQL